MAKAKYIDDDACITCGTLGGGHDCDCWLSPYPKCSRCHGAYGVPHAITGEELTCLCGEEAE
jgi:hypothetical protein